MKRLVACLLLSLLLPLAVTAQHRVYIPMAHANHVIPTPVPPRHWAKGLSIFRRASDFTQTGSTYAITWWEPRAGDQATAGPEVTVLCQVRDMLDLAELDLYEGQTMIRLFNEPELSGQANMTLEQVVDGIYTVHTRYPDVQLGTPELVVGPTWWGGGYTHADVVNRYATKYGERPPYDFVALHMYAPDAYWMEQVVGWADAELLQAGLDDLPIYVTEFGPYPAPYAATWREAVDVAIAWFDARPTVVMAAYHPAYDWTWDGFSWIGASLCNEDGTLTEIGQWWAEIE